MKFWDQDATALAEKFKAAFSPEKAPVRRRELEAARQPTCGADACECQRPALPFTPDIYQQDAWRQLRANK